MMLVDGIIEIADKAGDFRRTLMRIEARKWYLGKLCPKKYGHRRG
jgi:hypothetical protein